jgi:RND family efflux transporter MFP subunit
VSDVRSDIDLGGFARPSAEVPRPKRRPLRIVVPAAILLAFLAILATSLGDLWRGSVEVSVLRPKIVDASSTTSVGTPLFQAAGWIEPDPFAIDVSALAPGVVSDVLVQPSDVLKKGDVVARLIDQDARLACDSATAMLAQTTAELANAEAEAANAKASFDAALAVTESVATARADLAGKQAESTHRAQAAVRGEAQVKIAEEELGLQRELESAGTSGTRQVALAEAKLAAAKGDLEILRADAALAAAEAQKAQARFDRAQRDAELRLEEKLRIERAKNGIDLAKGRVAAARTTYDEALLRLNRMEVRAPADGIVLERLAAPGTTLSGGERGSLVCTLFDPAHLRVRVDVPQGEIAKANVGQRAEVLAESRTGKPYHGRVLRVVQKADIQKVTLQVHVLLEDADELLRPEMLCQVRFLSSGAGAAGAAATAMQSVLIPARLVQDGSSVWVVDGATRAARKRNVVLGAPQGEWVEVTSGLNVSDKLIDVGREGLKDGSLVRIREEN